MTQNSEILTSIGYKVATLDELRNRVPAAFSTSESPKLSDRYSFVPTVELLEAFEKLGWLPTFGKQNGSSPYARHMIRLANAELGFMDLKTDNVKPQIVLDNSHNGGSPAQMHMGLFRLVCTNGLVVSMPGMYTSVKLRHIGIDLNELKQLMNVVAEQYKTVGTHITEMQQYVLNAAQREEFVMKAIAHREPHVFISPDGTIDFKKITSMVNPTQILEPLRSEDKKEDLWSIFNVVQERLVKGEFERTTAKGRKAKPRGITNATRNIDFNRILWGVAEDIMRPIPQALVEIA